MGWRWDKFHQSLKFKLRVTHHPRSWLPRLQGETAPGPVGRNHPSEEKEPTLESLHSLDRFLAQMLLLVTEWSLWKLLCSWWWIFLGCFQWF